MVFRIRIAKRLYCLLNLVFPWLTIKMISLFFGSTSVENSPALTRFLNSSFLSAIVSSFKKFVKAFGSGFLTSPSYTVSFPHLFHYSLDNSTFIIYNIKNDIKGKCEIEIQYR